MRREQLEHVLRAASTIVGEHDVLVIGSQAVLASFPDDRLPSEATTSIEEDLAFLEDPGDDKADRIDGAIGELSSFHETFGYYAQGVSLTTAILPAGWRERLIVLGHRTPTRAEASAWNRTTASPRNSLPAAGRTTTSRKASFANILWTPTC